MVALPQSVNRASRLVTATARQSRSVRGCVQTGQGRRKALVRRGRRSRPRRRCALIAVGNSAIERSSGGYHTRRRGLVGTPRGPECVAEIFEPIRQARDVAVVSTLDGLGSGPQIARRIVVGAFGEHSPTLEQQGVRLNGVRPAPFARLRPSDGARSPRRERTELRVNALQQLVVRVAERLHTVALELACDRL